MNCCIHFSHNALPDRADIPQELHSVLTYQCWYDRILGSEVNSYFTSSANLKIHPSTTVLSLFHWFVCFEASSKSSRINRKSDDGIYHCCLFPTLKSHESLHGWFHLVKADFTDCDGESLLSVTGLQVCGRVRLFFAHTRSEFTASVFSVKEAVSAVRFSVSL